MEKHEFEEVDPLVSNVAEEFDGLIAGDELKVVKAKLTSISRILGEEYSVTLDISLQVFDSRRAKSLPLLRTGLSAHNGGLTHHYWGDSSPQRYVVDGQLRIVPHDRCPACWGRWDEKDQHPSCDDCGVSMGDQVMWLLDNDLCPHCEEGKVTSSNPTCNRCGYTVNQDYIVWG